MSSLELNPVMLECCISDLDSGEQSVETIGWDKVIHGLLEEKGTHLVELIITDKTVAKSEILFIYLADTCPNLKVLDIRSSIFPIRPEEMRIFVSRCLKIENFSLIDGDATFTDPLFRIILTCSWTLKILKLVGAPISKANVDLLPYCLESLDIRGCKFLTVHSIIHIREQCPNIRRLITSLILDQNNVDNVRTYWPDIQSLMVVTKNELNFNLYKLKELVLFSSIRDFSLNTLFQQIKTLDTLQLETKSVRCELIHPTPKVRTLEIKTDEPLQPDIVMSIPFFKNLARLGIRGTDISNSIQDILNHCKKIQFIKNLDCYMKRDQYDKLHCNRTVEITINLVEKIKSSA